MSTKAQKGDSPLLLLCALSFLGVHETRRGHNADILNMYYLAGFPEIQRDEVHWCAAFICACLALVGGDHTHSLLAKSFMTYGVPCEPQPGAIAVFDRGRNPKFGHVGVIESVDGDHINLVGGNQSDSASIVQYKISSIRACRWPVDREGNPL